MTIFNQGDRVRFTSGLDINDFSASKRIYLMESFGKVFTVKKSIFVDGEEEITLDDITLSDCFFKPNELEITIDNSTLTPKEYIDKFDNIMFRSLQRICDLKGIELQSSSELLSEIRDSIIEHMANWRMDISIPEIEYNIGNKVLVYYEGLPQEATIVCLGEEHYGLLLNDYRVVYQNEISDSPTDYIINLQKIINIE